MESSRRCTNRLAAIPRVRAPAIARLIQMKSCQPGQPPAAKDHPNVSERQGKQGFVDTNEAQVKGDFADNNTGGPRQGSRAVGLRR